MLARPSGSSSWRLVTPPGVADNGGLVASAGGARSLTIAVRPSRDLVFSPLAATANGGTSWSTGGPVNAAVAASPGAFAADGSYLAALLSDGTIETSSDAGATWSTLAQPGAIAASPAAKGCDGAVRVTSISFGIGSAQVLAGGSCGTSGTTVFSYSPGTGWQRVSMPVSGPLIRLTGAMALVQGKSGLSALWRGTGWYAYAPLPAHRRSAAPRGWDESAAAAGLRLGHRVGHAPVWRGLGAAARGPGGDGQRARNNVRRTAVAAAAAGAFAYFCAGVRA